MIVLIAGRPDNLTYTAGSLTARNVRCLDDDGAPIDLTVAGRLVYVYVGSGTNVFSTFLFRLPVTPTGGIAAYGAGTISIPSSVAVTVGQTYYMQAYVDDGSATGIGSVQVLTTGAGLRTAPDVTFTDSTGTGATATAKLLPAGVSQFRVISQGNFGNNFTPPGVTVTSANGDGSNAAGTAVMLGTVGFVTVSNPGTYSRAPTGLFVTSGGSGGGASLSPVYIGGLGAVYVQSGGTFSGTPTGWTITVAGAGGTGAGAVLEVDFAAGSVQRVRVAEPGVNYATPVTVTIVPVGATAITPVTVLPSITGGSWSWSGYSAANLSAPIGFATSLGYTLNFPAGTAVGTVGANGPRVRLTFNSGGGVGGVTMLEHAPAGTGPWTLTLTPKAAYGGTAAIISVDATLATNVPTITNAGSLLVATPTSPTGALVAMNGGVPSGGSNAACYVAALRMPLSTTCSVNGVGSAYPSVELGAGYQAGSRMTALLNSVAPQLRYQSSAGLILDSLLVTLQSGAATDAYVYARVSAVQVVLGGTNYSTGTSLSWTDAGATILSDAASLALVFNVTLGSVTLNGTGSLYTTAPVVTLSPSNGAVVVAELGSGLASVNMSAPGANYVNPTVVLTTPSPYTLPSTVPTTRAVFNRSATGEVSQLLTLKVV